MSVTVAQLIAELSEFPPDMPVVIAWDGRYAHDDEPGFTLSDYSNLYPGNKSGPIVLIEA